MALQDSLHDYYVNHVEIAPDRMKSAKDVAEAVKDDLLQFLQAKSTFPVSGIVGAGSAYEGLKVIGPDEFDMQLMLKVPGLSVQDDKSVPDYALIRAPKGEYEAFTTGKGFLNPKKILSDFQGKFAQFQKSYKKPDISVHLRQQGPALTLDVKFSKRPKREISIDFVPVVVVGKQHFVAKQYHDRDSFQEHWRYSFTIQERERLSKMPKRSCHKMVLQVFKAIRLNHYAQFGMLRSYIYKVVLLHLLEDRPDLDWSSECFADRFDDYMMSLKECFEDAHLRHFKVPTLNMLEQCKPVSLKNISEFITRARRNNYKDLLRKREYVSRG